MPLQLEMGRGKRLAVPEKKMSNVLFHHGFESPGIILNMSCRVLLYFRQES